jgi:uncharacterized OB-fold protein
VTDILVPSLGMGLIGNTPITPETAPHWKAAAEGQFAVPTCDDCGTNRWPVTYACYVCGSRNWRWASVPGTGRVFTYTWLDSPTHPTDTLNNIAVIELDGTKGEPVRVPGWVVGVDKSTLVCEMPVRVAFDPVTNEVAVPYWVPA